MKKSHKGLLVGGFVAGITGLIGTIMGGMFLDKKAALKSVGKVAGEFGSSDGDDMGAEDDPIINVAKTL
jgi:hypothetical protein